MINKIHLLIPVVAFSVCFFAACTSENNKDKNANPTVGSELFQKRNFADFGLENSKKLALTFDDGPTKAVTEALLQVLRKHHVHATFFILARGVEGQENTLRKMQADGHVIGNHSYSHQQLSKAEYTTNPELLFHQVVESNRVIEPFMNPAHRAYFRAPYGAWTSTHAKKLNAIDEVSHYVGPVFWNIGGELISNKKGVRPTSASDIRISADWDCWTKNPAKNISPLSPEVCAQGYLNEIESKKGGVVLMHDVEMGTVEMVKILLPKLIRAGYEFVTLEDLRSIDKYE